jgi:hypothetical protein
VRLRAPPGPPRAPPAEEEGRLTWRACVALVCVAAAVGLGLLMVRAARERRRRRNREEYVSRAWLRRLEEQEDRA